MRIKPDNDLTLAFAGIFQSATLVYQLAVMDRHDTQALHDSCYSLLRLDAKTTEGVFSSRRGVNLGLRTLVKILSTRAEESTREIFQYTVGMHQLSMKLMQYDTLSEAVGEGLSEIQQLHLRHYGNFDEDEALYEKLAALYSRNISTLTPRIIVNGAQEKLADSAIANRVRATLFAGIRSAFLWHQLGGRRWHLFLTRKDYQRTASELLLI